MFVYAIGMDLGWLTMGMALWYRFVLAARPSPAKRSKDWACNFLERLFRLRGILRARSEDGLTGSRDARCQQPQRDAGYTPHDGDDGYRTSELAPPDVIDGVEGSGIVERVWAGKAE